MPAECGGGDRAFQLALVRVASALVWAQLAFQDCVMPGPGGVEDSTR